VLALRGAGGLTLGANEFLGNYQLGGSIGDTAFYVTPDAFRMLRGYPFGYDLGDMYWLGSAEYRLPLWHIHRGVGTIPAYARNLSAAAFVDSGNAFNAPSEATTQGTSATQFADAATTDSLVGVGGEISFRTVLFWTTSFTGRFGYAVPLTVIEPVGTTYMQVGGSF
jgi:hypothetical protein